MRRKRKLTLLLAAVLLTFGTTGCGENQIPELSDDEVQAVGEYVALTMMKYDINNRSRLMELVEPLPPDTAVEPSETEEPEDLSGMRPVEDTLVVNGPEGEEGAVSSYTVEEVMGLPEGLSLTFQGEEIYDSYPGEGEFFSLNASEGKKLMVLNFMLSNAGAGEQNLDLLGSNTAFHVTVNGEYTRRALPTILLNDLSTFVGAVPGEGSVEVVLVVEVEESLANAVTSLSLSVKGQGETSEIKAHLQLL